MEATPCSGHSWLLCFAIVNIYSISSTGNNGVTVTFSLHYMKKPNKHHHMITSTIAKPMQINLIHTPCPIRSLKKSMTTLKPQFASLPGKLKTLERKKWSSERKIPNQHLYPESILELASIEQLLSVSLFSPDCLTINYKDTEYTSNSFINNKNFEGQLSWNKDDIYFTLIF